MTNSATIAQAARIRDAAPDLWAVVRKLVVGGIDWHHRGNKFVKLVLDSETLRLADDLYDRIEGKR